MTMFEQKRIDVPLLRQREGALFKLYASKYPFVMLNYLGRARDISTLAHELGHAIHSVYSKNRRYGISMPFYPYVKPLQCFVK